MHNETLNEEILELAVLLPADIANEACQNVPSNDGDCTVKISVAPFQESRASLGFDPFLEITELAWVTISIMGTAVANVARRIIQDYLWSKCEDWKKGRQIPGLQVRTRSGKQFTVRFDSVEDRQQFEEWLNNNRRSRK